MKKEGGRLKMGTAVWRSIDSLSIDSPGEEVDTQLIGSGKMFMGRNRVYIFVVMHEMM